MHGLINRSIENFLRETYGDPFWSRLMQDLDTGFERFEAMLQYDDALTQRVVDAAAGELGKQREELLEDFGTYLVTDPKAERVRRLLRFGGVDYEDFLHSLDDLPDRVRLAVPDMDMPELQLEDLGSGMFSLSVRSQQSGFGHVLLGVLRALADDYGSLVFLEHTGRARGQEEISIRLLDAAFSDGRDFVLAQMG